MKNENLEITIKEAIKEKIEKSNPLIDVASFLSELKVGKQGKNKPLFTNEYIGQGTISDMELSDALISECIFENINFIQISFDEIQMVNCAFINCRFEKCEGIVNFEGSVFSGTNFNGCNLYQSSFIKAKFFNTAFKHSKMNNSNFSLSNYRDLIIENCEYPNTSLEESRKDNVNIFVQNQKAKITMLGAALSLLEKGMGIDGDTLLDDEMISIKKIVEQLEDSVDDGKYQKISQKELDNILSSHDREVAQPVKTDKSFYLDLSKYDFSNMNFQEHNLTGIDFSGSIMKNACLAGCVCYDCNFSDCNLDGAIMFGVSIMRNIYEGASLENIIIDKKNRILLENAGVIKDNIVRSIPDAFHMDDDGIIDHEDF